MSFSGDVKEELSRNLPAKRHCMRAELAAILLFAGSLQAEQDGCRVIVETEHVSLAKKYLRLLRSCCEIELDLDIHKTPSGRNHQYTILLDGREDPVQDERIRQMLGEMLVREGETLQIQDAVLQRDCCKRAFLCGAFLAAGSMSDPGKSYHFEIVCREPYQARVIQLLMRVFEVPAKIVPRKGRYIVYLKDSSRIVDILNVLGAHHSLMELENIRIIKEIKNGANRQLNCDSANINKTVQTAARQLEGIHYIEEHYGLDRLTPVLREMAKARLEHPDASLQELGTYLDPPVGKSGVNHRLRKLEELARELKSSGQEAQ